MTKEQIAREGINVFENEVVKYLSVTPQTQVYLELNDILKKLHY